MLWFNKVILAIKQNVPMCITHFCKAPQWEFLSGKECLTAALKCLFYKIKHVMD